MVYKVQVRLHDVVLVTKNYELYRLTKVHGAHIRAQGSHTLSVCVCVCVCVSNGSGMFGRQTGVTVEASNY